MLVVSSGLGLGDGVGAGDEAAEVAGVVGPGDGPSAPLCPESPQAASAPPAQIRASAAKAAGRLRCRMCTIPLPESILVFAE
jgi:hypothetical protein